MQRLHKVAVASAAVAAVAAGLAAPAMAAHPKSGQRLDVVGLTADRKLVTFTVDRPGTARSYVPIKGLQGDARLVGIDYRVQDGHLYGVGDRGGVYTVRPQTGRSTKVGQLSVALSGTSFGVDFNPAADRLRIVSDTGQNLRHNVNAGGTTLADTGLSYPPATTPAVGVTAAAYTNNDADADTATTLYDLDTAMDQVALQSPANSGQLSAVGKLGVDAGAEAGFDIHSSVRKGTAVDATGYAVLTAGSRTGLYRISLVTGKADRIGNLPTAWRVTDLAVALHRR